MGILGIETLGPRGQSAEDHDKREPVIIQAPLVMFCRTNANRKPNPYPSQNSGCLIRSVDTSQSYDELMFVIMTTN
jgi:hypothetical protein